MIPCHLAVCVSHLHLRAGASVRVQNPNRLAPLSPDRTIGRKSIVAPLAGGPGHAWVGWVAADWALAWPTLAAAVPQGQATSGMIAGLKNVGAAFSGLGLGVLRHRRAALGFWRWRPCGRLSCDALVLPLGLAGFGRLMAGIFDAAVEQSSLGADFDSIHLRIIKFSLVVDDLFAPLAPAAATVPGK